MERAPRKCVHCSKSFTPAGNNQQACEDCRATRCTKCGRIGEHGTNCPRRGKAAKPTAAKPKKPKPARRAPVVAEGATNGHSTAARIRGLVQAVALGKDAEKELAAIREALDG